MSFVAFGEIMLRLTSSAHGGKLWCAKSFNVDFAGSESNVASSLAILGNHVKFITKLPRNHLGKAAISSLNSFGVDTQSIVQGGSRIGTYFIEIGSSIRPSEVVYDRAHSAISEIASNEFNWKAILENKDWVFISGITAALSEQCAREAFLLAITAKEMGVKVCFDFNFRRTLWKNGDEAKRVFSEILKHTDLLCGNTGALSDVYRVEFKGDTELDRVNEAIAFTRQELGLEMSAFTIRDHASASKNVVSGALSVRGNLYTSSSYAVEVIDRFGTGDAFAAALLHAIKKGWGNEKAIEFATAAFALKHTIRGDQHTSNEGEIISIMEGKTSGHVIR